MPPLTMRKRVTTAELCLSFYRYTQGGYLFLYHVYPGWVPLCVYHGRYPLCVYHGGISLCTTLGCPLYVLSWVSSISHRLTKSVKTVTSLLLTKSVKNCHLLLFLRVKPGNSASHYASLLLPEYTLNVCNVTNWLPGYTFNLLNLVYAAPAGPGKRRCH